MTSRFQSTFQERGMPALNRAFGDGAVLIRDGVPSESFTAQWTAVEYEIEEEEGFATKVEGRNFTFDKSDAVISSTLIKPRSGDRIQITENGETLTFQLMQFGKMPAVESMAGGFRWKVHTKKVG